MIVDLQKKYEIRFSSTLSYRVAVWKCLVDVFFQQTIGANKVIFDLGCGYGEFINHIQAEKKYGMDMNPDSPNKLNEEVIFLQQDCSDPWPLADGALDVVFSSNFFEHLQTKTALVKALNEAFRCLRPEGQLICMGPNIKYVGQSYWDFFDHYIELSHLSMVEVLQTCHFHIQSVIPRFLPYTMSQRRQPPVFLLKWYLQLKLLWPLFGKQFLIIANKPKFHL